MVAFGYSDHSTASWDLPSHLTNRSTQGRLCLAELCRLPCSPTAVCVIRPTTPLVTPPPLANCVPFSAEAGWAKAAGMGEKSRLAHCWPKATPGHLAEESVIHSSSGGSVPACESFLPGLALAMCHGLRNCEGDFVSTQRSKQKSPSVHAFDFWWLQLL